MHEHVSIDFSAVLPLLSLAVRRAHGGNNLQVEVALLSVAWSTRLGTARLSSLDLINLTMNLLRKVVENAISSYYQLFVCFASVTRNKPMVCG